MSSFRTVLLSAVAVVTLTVPGFAEEWVATKLRGLAFVHSNGEWQPLKRGDAVDGFDVVRTLPSGRAEFTRGTETISLAGDSQIRVVDARNEKFTTVHQAYGKVTVDADKENVQHFAVQTRYLAAVVKGTVFTVVVRDGQASVSVDEGRVQVQDTVHQVSVDVLAGQQAQASDTQLLTVSGRGAKEPVLDAGGASIPARELAALRKAAKQAGRGAENGNAGTGGGGKAASSEAGAKGGKAAGNASSGGNGQSGGPANAGGNLGKGGGGSGG